METVRDRLWIWGHEAGSHNTGWSLPKASRMTPLEGACYLGVPNLIMVRYDDRPQMPFDQYALALRPLKRVYWSLVGAGGRSSEAEREHVLGLAPHFPNIVGIFMDDFFHPPDQAGDVATLSLDQIASIKRELLATGRGLKLGVTLYTHQLGMPVGPHLELCDHVSLWTWVGSELKALEANFEKLEHLAPSSRKLLGLYMWDYGLCQPMPVELMEMQTRIAARLLREGRIDGMIFLASCICDLELEAVEWARHWIAANGDQRLAG